MDLLAFHIRNFEKRTNATNLFRSLVLQALPEMAASVRGMGLKPRI